MSNKNSSVYFLQSYIFTKIGHAKDVKRRVSSIQIGSPFEVNLVHTIDTPYTLSKELESDIHNAIWNYRYRGEWFVINKTCIQKINKVLKGYDNIKREQYLEERLFKKYLDKEHRKETWNKLSRPPGNHFLEREYLLIKDLWLNNEVKEVAKKMKD